MSILNDLYALGRQKKSRTLSRGLIKTGSGGRPVIVTITDTSGKSIGDFWISDIQALMQSARMMGDTPTTNPNIIAIRAILDDMIKMEKNSGQFQSGHQATGF